MLTEVDDPGFEAIGGNIHGKGEVGDLLKAHSAQAMVCPGEVDEVVSATLSKDAREKLGWKGFESGARWHAEGRGVDDGGEMDQEVPPIPHVIYRRLERKRAESSRRVSLKVGCSSAGQLEQC
jgi:hypothetical protein